MLKPIGLKGGSMKRYFYNFIVVLLMGFMIGCGKDEGTGPGPEPGKERKVATLVDASVILGDDEEKTYNFELSAGDTADILADALHQDSYIIHVKFGKGSSVLAESQMIKTWTKYIGVSQSGTYYLWIRGHGAGGGSFFDILVKRIYWE